MTDLLTLETPDIAAQMDSYAGDCAASTTSVVLGVASPTLLCGLESLVVVTAGMRLAGTARSIDAFIACCARVRRGVALVDPFLGRQTVREFMQALQAAAPQMRAVLMSDDPQPHVVREALRIGACGFVSQTADTAEIRAALVAAGTGRRYIASGIGEQLAESLSLEELTNREMQVLGLLSQGDCNKLIARRLDVTVGTVKTHVRAIMAKLGSHSRTEVVLKAFRLGLVALSR